MLEFLKDKAVVPMKTGFKSRQQYVSDFKLNYQIVTIKLIEHGKNCRSQATEDYNIRNKP